MMMACFHPLVQNLFNLMRVVIIHRGGTQRIANQVNRLVISHHLGIAGKYTGLCRVFDMFLQCDRVASRKADHFKEQAEKIAVVRRLPFRPLENFCNVFSSGFYRRQIIGQQECSKRRPADDHHFEGQ